jgi:hypothetical protein
MIGGISRALNDSQDIFQNPFNGKTPWLYTVALGGILHVEQKGGAEAPPFLRIIKEHAS